MRSPMILSLCFVALVHSGCSDARMGSTDPPAAEATRPYASKSAPGRAMVTDGSSATTIPSTPPAADRAQAPQGYAGMMMRSMMGTAIQPPPEVAALSRKIIYDGEIDLIVKDVDAVARQVVKLVQDARGYIAEQSTTGSPGARRAVRWKLRLPVESFEATVEKVAGLGELERNTRTSQDVTEQFYDLEARIKNKKAEEKSLTKILDERTGKLEDILKIETELSRVRGEIEQLEGKIRVLENLSSLATLVVSVREREQFEPPPPRGPRLPHPGRSHLGELAPRPGEPRQERGPLGRRVGRLGAVPPDRSPARLAGRALALAPPAPPARPPEHAPHPTQGPLSHGCFRKEISHR